jgi:hypothetical protein
MLDRFDLSDGLKNLVNAAVRLDVIDAVEVLCLGSAFANAAGAAEMQRAEDLAADMVMACAFANRHGALGRSKHAELCQLNDVRAAAARAANPR